LTCKAKITLEKTAALCDTYLTKAEGERQWNTILTSSKPLCLSWPLFLFISGVKMNKKLIFFVLCGLISAKIFFALAPVETTKTETSNSFDARRALWGVGPDGNMIENWEPPEVIVIRLR
jgi:hypothetical protein